ncbi:MAG: hypothetical protein KC777_27105 [Cyanobacteria bacterium HKST-UBA02]|nr:hypothetical protein [Cyanobacteria bacterium HKST-UBA02]
MKNKARTAILVVAASFVGYQAAHADALVNGLIPAGNTSLPQGKYMLTNLQSGQALYIEIESSGRMLAQDPRAMQFSAVASQAVSNPISTIAPGLQKDLQKDLQQGLQQTTQSGVQQDQSKKGLWGGLLKQGVESLLQNQAPNSTP